MEQNNAEPEFREPTISQWKVGDNFAWTHEKRLNKSVSLEGTIVEVFDNRIQVNVGSNTNPNYYEINEVGRVVSISKNYNRTGVGYCVY